MGFPALCISMTTNIKPHRFAFPLFILRIVDNYQKKQRLGKNIWMDTKGGFATFILKLILGICTMIVIGYLLQYNGYTLREGFYVGYFLVINRNVLYELI